MQVFILTLLILMTVSCKNNPDSGENSNSVPDPEVQIVNPLQFEGEGHLNNIRQLSFGGNNAECYWSFDNKHLVYQKEDKANGIPCDRIYMSSADADTLEMSLISTGTGRTTCSYFLPGNEKIIYASTHLSDEDCPPEPDHAKLRRYVWPIYSSFEIFISDLEGIVLSQLTDNNYYDAEPTVSPVEDLVVFTSTRSGDLELWTMRLDGSELKQITDGLGYDGGAFFSPDGQKLLFRASRPQTEEEIADYKNLLSENLVAPSSMELYTCNKDGSDLKQITDLGHANWAPYFHPSGEKILFSSNHVTGGRQFNIFMIDLNGENLEQITFDEEFDAFPMFSFDGKKLVWSSNRNNGGNRATNVFMADWVD